RKKYRILDWDSEFFGIKVSRVTQPSLGEETLRDLLVELRGTGVSLVYWPAGRELRSIVARRLHGHLVDVKTTFAVNLGSLELSVLKPRRIVERYSPPMSLTDLEYLALEAGRYSRFAVDPNIPRERFEALYRAWIRRSLRKEIAREVLVIRERDRVVGMITLGDKSGRGDIGLVAVASDCRGRKYGQTLVRAAQLWFLERGYASGQVVTQGKNIPACNLYKKCGFSVDETRYFYHFWLAES
ncbi:MAG: GNAT family N-acetyltransferase, partial [Thermoanaerobaculia bacterium]